MICLDLGAGDRSPDGYRPMGRDHGTEVYPLAYADGTVDKIIASHLLEHFPHGQIDAVLADWVRALRPGGELKIAVPDFEKIAANYLAGTAMPTEAFLMGGQIDNNDYHKALFDASTLRRALGRAGLVLVRNWTSELGDDCAALPISLNLAGTKPFVSQFSTTAVMSLPRITWTTNANCSRDALVPLKINLISMTGAYWGQCLERGIEQALEEGPDAVLTLDYDTVFTKSDVSTMIQLMMCYPDADAIAPVQSARGNEHSLFTVRGDGKTNMLQMESSAFAGDLTQVSTAHFGMTMIRASKLRDMPKPWLHDKPAPDGSWNEGRVDADIGFWRNWEAVGNTLFLANRVPVGHLDMMVRWPGQDLKALYQPHEEWRGNGPPKEVWR